MYHGLNILRGISACFIVGNHISLSPRTEVGSMVTSFCNLFVPVFGCISGFLLARSMQNANGSLFDVVKRRFRRLFLPFAFWTVVYVVESFCFAILTHSQHKIERIYDMWYWLSVVFCGGASTHLWYLPSLFYSVVATVCLARILPMVMKSFVALCLFSLMVIVVAVIFNGHHWATYDLRLFGFVLLGCAIYVVVEISVIPSNGCIGICIGMAAAYVAFKDVAPGFVLDWLMVCPLCIIAANKRIRCIGFFEALFKCSMGIFFLHPMFTMILTLGVIRFSSQPYNIIDVLFVWVGAIAISVPITIAMRKSRYLARFVQ